MKLKFTQKNVEENVAFKLVLQLSYFCVIETTYGRDHSKLLRRGTTGVLYAHVQEENVHQDIYSKIC